MAGFLPFLAGTFLALKDPNPVNWILSLDFKEVLPEETELSKKSLGYSLAKKLDKFWDVVNSKFKIEPPQEYPIPKPATKTLLPFLTFFLSTIDSMQLE